MNSEMEDLLEQWLEGSLEADQETRLMNWLTEDPAHMQHFVERGIRDQLLREAASGLFIEGKAERALRDALLRPPYQRRAPAPAAQLARRGLDHVAGNQRTGLDALHKSSTFICTMVWIGS